MSTLPKKGRKQKMDNKEHFQKQVKVSVPKWKYEATIVDLYNDLSCRPYNEEVGRNNWGEPITQKLTLYYSNDEHIGTWHSGSGWYYEVK
jgi:hypothetical protein